MNLIGLHDREATAISPAGTWILDTVAISENPIPIAYSEQHEWITRLNWGYGDTGTIPLTSGYTSFSLSVAAYVRQSRGCSRWIIGNEPNLSREWPQREPIFPWHYAVCYRQCREAIHSIPHREKDQVLIAAPGPWNVALKYPGNSNGDWIKYFTDVIDECEREIDGFSIHAYTHGYSRDLVWSEATMNPPFQTRHYNFRTYQDYCNAIPDSLAHLPIYLTEANGNGPWRAAGLMPAMTSEINDWNQSLKGDRQIKCLIFFRYPNFGDGYAIQGNQSVISEYLAAANLNYQSPAILEKEEDKIFMPQIESPPKKGIVTAELLNVRDKPGVPGSAIVSSRSRGNLVDILEQRDLSGTLWYRIGENQWVTSSWIEVEGESPLEDNWSRSLAFTLRWEGGWSDNPADPGGATMKGITLGTYIAWQKERGKPEPTKEQLRNIPDSEVEKIYHDWYWIPSKAYQMPWPMCLAQFDLAVNGGVARAEQAFSATGLDFWDYMIWRRDWYRRLSDFKIFGKGWIGRCEDLILTAYR